MRLRRVASIVRARMLLCDTVLSLPDAEMNETQTQRLYINAIIGLYEALWGGWNPENDE